MSEEATKTYVFGQDNNSLLSMLAPLCQQKGIDPNILLAMKEYISYYGWHFNKKMCEFACKNMYKTNNNVREYITPFTKEQVDNLLYNYGIKLNDTTYDYVYVANMCKADFYGSSIQNEQQLCLYIKDMIEDNDAYEGMVFTRFYADCIGSGTPIYWEEFL